MHKDRSRKCMHNINLRLIRTLLLTLLVACFTTEAMTAEVHDPLPDPDNKPADTTKPIKVYIMMGQSNMLGFGQVGPADTKGTLEYITKTEKKFAYLIDDKGQFIKRNDVYCVQMISGMKGMSKLWLSPGISGRGKFIGPELGFGHVVGHAHDEHVLLLKACIGNRALGWDLMPPSSRTIPPEEHENQYFQGWQYEIHMKDIRNVLSNLGKFYPDYKEQGYEVAGFVWWQGHKDQSTPKQVKDDNWANSYEKNMVNLINDLRKQFKAPKAPFVVATIGFEGDKLAGSGLTIANAQLAVDGENGKYPAFKGNVSTIDSRPYWKNVDQSPNGAGYHYNHNAETYMRVGEALGRAMVELHEQAKE